jgi:hypothetical protein
LPISAPGIEQVQGIQENSIRRLNPDPLDIAQNSKKPLDNKDIQNI